MEPVYKGEPLVDLEEWNAAEADLDPEGGLAIGIELNTGADGGVSMVVAGKVPNDDRTFFQSFGLADRDSAYAVAREFQVTFGLASVLVGARLVGDRGARDLRARQAGSTEARTGVALLREELAAGRIAHWCGPEHQPCPVTAQLAQARVTVTAAGNGSIVSPGRLDAVRAMLWALTEMVQNPPVIPRIYRAARTSSSSLRVQLVSGGTAGRCRSRSTGGRVDVAAIRARGRAVSPRSWARSRAVSPAMIPWPGAAAVIA